MYLIADLLELEIIASIPLHLFQASQWNTIGLGHITALSSSTQGSNIAADGAKGSRGDHKILVQPWSNKSGKGSVDIELILGRGSIRRKNCHRLSMRVGKLGGEYSDFLGYQSTQSGV